MKTYKLYREQYLDGDMDTVWDFFSSPENLDILTPENMGFEIKTPKPLPKMYKGQIIEYTVRPVLNLPIFWRTEITEVEDNKSFIDEQRKGPYKLWRHQHIFEETSRGIKMIDDLEYALPMGPVGSLVHKIYVKNRLKEIFDYRYEQVDKIFNKSEGLNNSSKASGIQRSSPYQTPINVSS